VLFLFLFFRNVRGCTRDPFPRLFGLLPSFVQRYAPPHFPCLFRLFVIVNISTVVFIIVFIIIARRSNYRSFLLENFPLEKVFS